MTNVPGSLRSTLLGMVALLGASAAMPAQAALPQGKAGAKNASPVDATKKDKAAQSNPAERAFQANCNRCHNAPESLSPRITGTVVRHMRVRANLSAEEERLILSYFNP